jgi:predicted enzyme related to lactoylglutathione lyase
MANKHGDFIWYELMTTDADAATGFYESILPWTIAGRNDDGMDYRQIGTGSGAVGGVLNLTSEMTDGGARPVWIGYIAVDDVDKMASSIGDTGGKILMPAHDLPGVGRFALVTDQQGAPFYIMKPTPPADQPDASSNAFAADHPIEGHCAWNELYTADPAAALHFYGVRFGWVKDGEMDMGPMGKYEFIRHGGLIGAVMPLPPHVPVSGWNYYFRVADIDKAAAAVTANGGQVLHGPMEVPGGDWTLNAMDPQGAMFALVGGKG